MRLVTFFLLGRVSNLPTIWSDCLAAWWLGGVGNYERLPALFLGVSFLYTGGMFLNDAFDVNFDREYRRERPIPSGKISSMAVWRWGFAWLALGEAALFYCGILAGLFGLVLTFCILLYDSIHKKTLFAPMLMGICRLLVYIVAAATASAGVDGWTLWSAIVLGCYVSGLSYLARLESKMERGLSKPQQPPTDEKTEKLLRPGKVALRPPWWPILLLTAPIILALFPNSGRMREGSVLLSAVLVLWIARCLRTAFSSSERNIGRSISGLLAGIVLVDWLAVANGPREISAIFIGLFLFALLFQRFVPGT